MGEIIENFIYYNVMLNMNTVKHLTAELYMFQSDVDAIQGKYLIDAKSIMGMFSLDLTRSVTIRIHRDEISEHELHDLENLLKEYIV